MSGPVSGEAVVGEAAVSREKKAVTSYFTVSVRENEMRSQSNLADWLEKYGNYNISRKVSIREHGSLNTVSENLF